MPADPWYGVGPSLHTRDDHRTFVGDLLEQGHDRATVQRRAGHAAPTTTARDDRRGAAPRARATADLPCPTGPDDAPATGPGG